MLHVLLVHVALPFLLSEDTSTVPVVACLVFDDGYHRLRRRGSAVLRFFLRFVFKFHLGHALCAKSV